MIARLLAVLAVSIPPTGSPVPQIVVEGQGSVSLPPELANIAYTVHGEGKSSNDAVAAMVAIKDKIEAELNKRTAGLDIRTGSVSVEAARGRECNPDDDDQARLSTGSCAVLGYVAEIPIKIRTSDVKDAGTTVGLIGASGGLNPHVGSFQLASLELVRRKALTAAFADARGKADAIAEAAHVRIGRVLSIVQPEAYGRGDDIVVTARRRDSNSIQDVPIVTLNPENIETNARVIVTYEIVP